MTVEEIQRRFREDNDEFLRFERIANPRHTRPDLCAFLMLHDLQPGKLNGLGRHDDMVAAAEHDEIFLDVDVEQLANAGITPEQVTDLIRCGVRWSSECDSLAMFV